MKIFLLTLAILLAGCATPQYNKNIDNVINTNKIQLDEFYSNGKAGKLTIFKSQDTLNRSVLIRLFGPATPNGTTGNSTHLGILNPNQGFVIYLPPGEYMLAVEGDSRTPLKFVTLHISGSETQYYIIENTGSPPRLSTHLPSNISISKLGSIFSDGGINNQVQHPSSKVLSWEPITNNSPLKSEPPSWS